MSRLNDNRQMETPSQASNRTTFTVLEAISVGEQWVNALEQLPDTEENKKRMIRSRFSLAMYCLNTHPALREKQAIEPISDDIDEQKNTQFLH